MVTEELVFIKETKGTVVYGNDEILAFYIPKDKLKANKDGIYPATVTITIKY